MTETMARIRFYIDPGTELPHIYNHDVTADEVEDILRRPGEDSRGREETRVAVGQTRNGRYLRVIYVPDEVGDGIFVITAYDLTGKALQAYRRRLRGRQS